MEKPKKTVQDQGEDEWSFELDSEAIAPAKVDREKSQERPKRGLRAEKRMRIEDQGKVVHKSRSAMAREMGPTRKPVKKEKVPANIVLRGIAFLIDLSLLAAGGVLSVMFGATITDIVTSLFELIGSEVPVMVDTYSVIGAGLFVYFCLNVLMVVFFRTTIGKLLMGLRVRGYHYVDLKFSSAIAREFLFKPVSMLLLVDFVMPLFNKDRRALHDFLAQTMVVKK